MSLAMAVLDQVGEVLSREGSPMLLEIHLSVGVLSGIDKDALQFGISLALENSPYKTADVFITEEPLIISCRKCQNQSQLSELNLCCLHCDSTDVSTLSGRDLRIQFLKVS